MGRGRPRPQDDSGTDQHAPHGLREAVGPRADEGCRTGGCHRDEPGEEGGALGADALHGHVPAHESDDGDDHRLPQQRGGLRAVGAAQPCAAVDDQADDRRLDRGDRAHGGRQQPRTERSQHRHGQHREADLAGQRAHREGDAGAVRTAPSLDGEGAGRDQRRTVQNQPSRTPALRQGDQDGHGDRGAAHEDARHRRFRRALGGEHGDVEADHADRREQPEPHPQTYGEPAQGCHAAPAEEREQEEARQAVAEELATRVGVVAQNAVGGERAADEDAGESGEKRSPHSGGMRRSGVPLCGPRRRGLPRRDLPRPGVLRYGVLGYGVLRYGVLGCGVFGRGSHGFDARDAGGSD